jgi:hypothetical protein
MEETITPTFYAAYSNRGGKNVHATVDHAGSSLAKVTSVCGIEVHNSRKPAPFDSTLDHLRCVTCSLVAGVEIPADDQPPARLRVQRRIGELPSLNHTLPHRDDLELSDVADYLDKLVEWFEKDRKSRAALEARLMRYTGAIAGLGNFLDVLDEVRS